MNEQEKREALNRLAAHYWGKRIGRWIIVPMKEFTNIYEFWN